MIRGRLGFLAGLLAGALVVVALLAAVDPLRNALPDSGPQSRTDEARQIIEESYFRETDPDKLEDASINGMVKAISKKNGDKFSHYFDPATYRRFQASTSGRFSGIGLSVGEDKRGLQVSQVFANTPAQRAGIKTGDLIVAVEGESIAGVSSTESSSRIKGPPGTMVAITVVDGKTGKRRDIDVERANVKIPSVVAKMKQVGGSKVGYVRLATFSRGAHGELRSAIDGLNQRGAQGLIFDLRGNGGGLLDEAVLVASIFQEAGPVVTIEGRARDRQTLNATGGALGDPGPIVVLVDGNTASASEIVTAALKENDLATVIGTRTFGKGVFQEVIELDGGGALDITVGEYLTANGTSILGKGVVPDEKVADKDLSDGDAALDAGLAQIGAELNGASPPSAATAVGAIDG